LAPVTTTSPVVLPSPSPLSGSLLDAEAMEHTGTPPQLSEATVVMVTGTIL